MNVLLDTHAFLWWIAGNPLLSVHAQSVIADPSTEAYLSVASGWEIAIKSRLGKLKMPSNLHAFMATHLQLNSIQVLPIQMVHALYVSTLPDYHRDPFDRLLVAQSQIENMPLLTSDPQIIRYGITVIW